MSPRFDAALDGKPIASTRDSTGGRGAFAAHAGSVLLTIDIEGAKIETLDTTAANPDASRKPSSGVPSSWHGLIARVLLEISSVPRRATPEAQKRWHGAVPQN